MLLLHVIKAFFIYTTKLIFFHCDFIITFAKITN